jgi:H+-transporting ATPase
VLGISTVLGVIGPIAAFGLFYLGDRVFDLGHPRVQTLMYLMLSVAGHLTIFLTRTRGPFWSIRPARILVIAVLGTQAIATVIAVYGLFMTPLGWGWAAAVWVYALAWFFISDRIKLLAYRILDPKTDKVFKSPASVVFDQTENHLHTISHSRTKDPGAVRRCPGLTQTRTGG